MVSDMLLVAGSPDIRSGGDGEAKLTARNC